MRDVIYGCSLTQVVKVVVDPGRDFWRDDKESMNREDQNPALSFVPALQLQQHRHFEQDL